MSLWMTVTGPLAEVDQTALDALRQGFTSRPSDADSSVLLWALAALCALVALLGRIYRWRERRRGPRRVDYLAIAAHRIGLERNELRLLRRLGTRSGLPCPTIMLLSPANLAHAARAAQMDDYDPRSRRQLSALSLRLFGMDLPAAPDAATNPP